jgi:hypothetical protein
VAVVRGSDTLSNQPGAKDKGLVADMPTLFPGAQLRLNSEDYRWDPTRKIYTVDWEKTLADSKAGTFADTAAVKQAVVDYGRYKDGSKKYDPAYSHYKVHKAWRHAELRFKHKC